MTDRLTSVTAAALLSLAGLAACDSSTTSVADPNANTSVSFTAENSANGSARVDPITIGGRTINVTSIELSLSEIEVEGDDAAKTEIRGTTVVVAVPTNGQLVTPITATLAAGIYSELELKVQTVRIRGTIDGSPFDVSVLVDDELETDIVPPLVVAQGTTANLTVSLDVSNWFRRPDGSAIDLANLNATLQGQLRHNIVASFEAFEDDDRSGHDDD